MKTFLMIMHTHPALVFHITHNADEVSETGCALKTINISGHHSQDSIPALDTLHCRMFWPLISFATSLFVILADRQTILCRVAFSAWGQERLQYQDLMREHLLQNYFCDRGSDHTSDFLPAHRIL